MCAAIDLDAAQVNGELVTPVRGRFGTQSGQSGSMSAKLTTRSPSNGSGASGGNGGVNSGPSEYRQPRWKPSVFDFKKSGGVCPTCQGSGRIPKGQEDELVALIPYNDKRLKPRRTWLYVILVVLAVVIVGGILTAFLVPRSLTITIVSLNSSNNSVVVKNSSSTFVATAVLEVVTVVKIHNSDFFPLRVNLLNNTLVHYDTGVGLVSVKPFSVAARSTKTVLQCAL